MVGLHKRDNDTQTVLPRWAIETFHAVCKLDKNEMITQFRERFWKQTERLNLINQQDEKWKYTDTKQLLDFTLDDEKASCLQQQLITQEQLADIVQQYRNEHKNAWVAVLVDGQYAEQLTQSHGHGIPNTIVISAWDKVFKDYAHLIEQNQHVDGWAHLAIALSSGGLYLKVKNGFKSQRPLHLLSLTTQSGIHHPSHVMIVEEGAELICIQHHIDVTNTQNKCFINEVIHIDIEQHARLSYHCLQTNNNAQTLYLGHTFVRQAKASEFASYHFALSGAFTRHDLGISLRGDNAKATTKGLYILNEEKQYQDFHIAIHHEAPHTQSEMFYKGIVNEKARAVFNGRLYVAPLAKKTKAYQANHNLLLHARGEVYSKPELEIYADDVQCKHGATIGKLNTEALFYLRSRGLTQQEAEQMLSQAFVAEIISDVPNKNIQQSLLQCVSL